MPSPSSAFGTHLVYFSSASGNTARFVDKLHIPAARIPMRLKAPELHVSEPYVLITPTYGEGISPERFRVRLFVFLTTSRTDAYYAE